MTNENETADLGSLTVKTAKEIADETLLNALRKERADQDDFWTFYRADPLMVMAAERIEELLAWHGTEQSMHAAWRKRAEEAEAALATVRAEERKAAFKEMIGLVASLPTQGTMNYRRGYEEGVRDALRTLEVASATENRKEEG